MIGGRGATLQIRALGRACWMLVPGGMKDIRLFILGHLALAIVAIVGSI
jgi:hypothetical protein